MAAPYTRAIAANTFRNNGATVFYAGNVPSTEKNVTKVLGMTHTGFKPDVLGSTIYIGASGVNKALSTGKFRYFDKEKFVIMTHNTTLNGSANTILKSGAADFRRLSINRSEKQNTIRQKGAGWNYVTGMFLVTPTVASDAFGNDHAARPTRLIPGELVIHENKLGTPTQKDYEAKNV